MDDNDTKLPWIGAEVRHVDGVFGEVLGPVPHMPGFFKMRFHDGVISNQKANAIQIDGESLDKRMRLFDLDFSGTNAWNRLCSSPIEFCKERIPAVKLNKLKIIQGELFSSIDAGRYDDASTKFALLPNDFWPEAEFLARVSDHREKTRQERVLQDELAQRRVMERQRKEKMEELREEARLREQEQAAARLVKLSRQREARVRLLQVVRDRQRLPDEDLLLLRELSKQHRMEVFTAADDLAPLMRDVLATLEEVASAGESVSAFDAFWKAHAEAAEHEPLAAWAPVWLKERIWQTKTYAILTPKQRMDALANDSLRLSEGLRKELIGDLVRQYASDAGFVRKLKLLPLRMRLEIMIAYSGELLRPIEMLAAEVLSEAGDPRIQDVQLTRLIKDFWARHESSLARGSPLFSHAPERIRRATLQRHFKAYFAELDRLFSYNVDTTGDWAAIDVYRELDADDRKLAELWTGAVSSEFENARMLSARAAEKVAGWFYKSRGHRVLDVALHQLSRESSNWKTHDLLLDGSTPVDVKNARLPVNSAAHYVEHTVPRFKRDRTGRGVKIVAVVSPYLQLRYLNDVQKAPFEVGDVRFLGETTYSELSRICDRFSNGALIVHNPSEGAFIPPWYFEFPSSWYQDFDVACRQLREMEWPEDHELLSLQGIDGADVSLPKYIAAGLRLPKQKLDVMQSWERSFLVKIQEACKPRASLAHLFLLILADFLTKLQEPPPNSFEPNDYLKFLLVGVGNLDPPKRQRPLGIEDPLETIQTLCSSLQQLWSTREYLSLGRFREYRLSSGGILQGREYREAAWETILSYCGGRIPGKGRCGCAPLVLGIEEQCTACRKLICRQCGYCSNWCAVSSGDNSIVVASPE
jgi:hypothetical protein